MPIRLYSLTEIARKLGRDTRFLKKRVCAEPVAVVAVGGYDVKLYRLEDFASKEPSK